MDKKKSSPDWIIKEKHIENAGTQAQKETIIYEIKHEKFNLWGLLNSSFFLWLLTSVIIAGATKWYQNKSEEIHLEQKVKAIDLEIESRLSQFLTAAKPLIKFQNDTTYSIGSDSCQKIFTQLWNELKTPPDKNKYIFTIHSEYKDASVISLMALLSGTLSELGYDVNEAKENGVLNWKDFETKSLEGEINALKASMRILMSNSVISTETGNQINVMQVFEYFFSMPSLKRWQWTYPYVDCGYKHPFC